MAISKDLELKKKVLRGNSSLLYIKILKDIRSLFQIEDVAKFNRLIKLLAINSANLLNINSLSSAARSKALVLLGNILLAYFG